MESGVVVMLMECRERLFLDVECSGMVGVVVVMGVSGENMGAGVLVGDG